MNEIKTWADRLLDEDVKGATVAMLVEIDDLRKALAERDAKLAAIELQEPLAYIWFPRKKPELAALSFQKEPMDHLKAVGWISEPLYAAASAAPKDTP